MKFKWILFNLSLILILIYLVVNYTKQQPNKASKLWEKELEFHDFITQIKPNTITLYYNNKGADYAEFFKLHNIFSPYKNIVNYFRLIDSVRIDYYLIKHYHNIKSKQKFRGDTLLIKQFKKYDIYLLKTQE